MAATVAGATPERFAKAGETDDIDRRIITQPPDEREICEACCEARHAVGCDASLDVRGEKLVAAVRRKRCIRRARFDI